LTECVCRLRRIYRKIARSIRIFVRRPECSIRAPPCQPRDGDPPRINVFRHRRVGDLKVSINGSPRDPDAPQFGFTDSSVGSGHAVLAPPYLLSDVQRQNAVKSARCHEEMVLRHFITVFGLRS
jgi:hypothetical protein